jgi:hypothetical protein
MLMRNKNLRGVLKTHTIRQCLLLFLAVCLTAGLASGEASKPLTQRLDKLRNIHGRFSFVVIGDTRSGGDNYSSLVRRAMEYKPNFVVNTGDMIFLPAQTLWADFWQRSKPITVPYFLTVGNHDVDAFMGEDLYKKEVDLPGNKLYYSFTVGGSLFVCLDSNIPGQEEKITDGQYKWLERELSTSGYEHKFVFVHHPLYPEKGKGNYYGDSLDKYPTERDSLEALFAKYKVNIVFVGHEHLYLRKVVDGIVHIITGGGGAPLYAGDKEGGFYHFIVVTVDGNEVTGKVIDINGKVRDTFKL